MGENFFLFVLGLGVGMAASVTILANIGRRRGTKR